MALAQLGRDEEAIAAYLEALRLDPNSGATMRMLGEAYTRRGCEQEAAAVLAKLRLTHPAQAAALEKAMSPTALRK